MKMLPFLSRARPAGRSSVTVLAIPEQSAVGTSVECCPAMTQMVVAVSVARWRTTWLIALGYSELTMEM